MINSFNNTSPNFGMALRSSKAVNSVLEARIKKTADIAKLNKIIDAQSKNNKVDIKLFVQPDGKSLSANMYARNTSRYFFFKNYYESVLSRIFRSPVGFINKLAKKADKIASQMEPNGLNIDIVLNKML